MLEPIEFKWRRGSPFAQPYLAFVSAIIGEHLIDMPEVTFRQVINKDYEIQIPGHHISYLHVNLRDARKMVREWSRGIRSNLTMAMTQHLVIVCYALVEQFNDSSMEFNFFRHLRNACAHGNRFTFDPKRVTGLPARWRELVITLDLKGQIAIPNFIREPDILLMLKDIEDKLPARAFDTE